MAQASADIDETDLEQRILQVLKGAGTPVKAAQLAKECQVPRKDINHVLYRMKDKLQVDCDDSAKWRLREGGPGEMVPTEPARPSHELQEQILRLLEASGPQRALSIAKSLGMKTSKDVNRYLYAMQEKHLLDFDKSSKTWKIYQPGTPRAPPPPIIYQQSPVMICQSGPHSHISIQNSEAVQIGHGNTIVKLTAPTESGDRSLPMRSSSGCSPQEDATGATAAFCLFRDTLCSPHRHISSTGLHLASGTLVVMKYGPAGTGVRGTTVRESISPQVGTRPATSREPFPPWASISPAVKCRTLSENLDQRLPNVNPLSLPPPPDSSQAHV
ncbi:Z-DNA-binding protein 1 isoform X3 [Myotis myotis]|uniref:Z-DNA-binding protein 1 isoform X3 n=1 Tax=Myotis myotis TaxID=51298 RepID=UPI001749DE25|nr:Z-DNA-binding protein 1 isoform X3 [Myotis myotis]